MATGTLQKGAIRLGAVPSSSIVGTVAPLSGATLPVSAGGCCGLMRPEEVAHMAYCLGNQVLGIFPGVDAHFRLRRETYDLHGYGVRVRRDIVRQQRAIQNRLDRLGVGPHSAGVEAPGRGRTVTGRRDPVSRLLPEEALVVKQRRLPPRPGVGVAIRAVDGKVDSGQDPDVPHPQEGRPTGVTSG